VCPVAGSSAAIYTFLFVASLGRFLNPFSSFSDQEPKNGLGKGAHTFSYILAKFIGPSPSSRISCGSIVGWAQHTPKMFRAGSTVLREGHPGHKYVVEKRDGERVTCRGAGTDQICVCDSSALTPVGFPHAANTVLGACSQAATDYPCVYHDATTETGPDVGAAALDFVRRDRLARGETERDDWMFLVGAGRGATVTDALSKWRMGTGEVSNMAVFSGALTPLTHPYEGPPPAPQRGRKEALKELEAQGALVAAALIGQQRLMLLDSTCGEYKSIPICECRTVDYANERTGTVHKDGQGGRQASHRVGGRRVQILLKEGEVVGFVMCSDHLKEIFCIMACKGLVLVISEDILEQVAHTAAAGPRSKTIVYNVTVPDSLCPALSRFACEVLEVQTAEDDLSPYERQRSCHIAHNKAFLRFLEIEESTASVKVRKTRAPRNARQLPRVASVPPARSTRGHTLLPAATHGQAQEPNGGRVTHGVEGPAAARSTKAACSTKEIRSLAFAAPGKRWLHAPDADATTASSAGQSGSVEKRKEAEPKVCVCVCVCVSACKVYK
jgi:hypothetical protein